MSAEQRYPLRQLGLGVYDYIASSLAEARTVAATGGRTVAGQQRGRAVFREWASTSASLLEQLLELTAHPAAGLNVRSVGSKSLTPLVDAVGGSLLAIRDTQATSQRVAAAASVLAPPATRGTASSAFGLPLVQALIARGISAYYNNGQLILRFPASVQVRCRLESDSQPEVGPSSAGSTGTPSNFAGRLILEPEAADDSDAGAAEPSSAAIDPPGGSILPPAPLLVPLVRYWITRLHEVVPDPTVAAAIAAASSGQEAEGAGAPAPSPQPPVVTLQQRTSQLASIHAVLSRCLQAVTLQHLATLVMRITRMVPVATASSITAGSDDATIDSDGASVLLRRLPARHVLHCHMGSDSVLCGALPMDTTAAASGGNETARAAITQAQAVLDAVLGAGADAGHSGAVGSTATVVDRVGTGGQLLPLGRPGAVLTSELARVLLAMASTADTEALLAAVPVHGTAANAESDARAFDASGRIVAGGAVVRPLPAVYRRLLAWLSGLPERRVESIYANSTVAGGESREVTATSGGNRGEAGAVTSTPTAAASGSDAGAATAARAVLDLVQAPALSPDFASVDIRLSQVSGEPSVSVRGLLDNGSNGCSTLPLLAAERRLVDVIVARRQTAHARMYGLAAHLLQARPDCRRALRSAGALVEPGHTQGLAISLRGDHYACGPLVLAVSLTSDDRLEVQLSGSLPAVPTANQPTTVLNCMRLVSLVATARLAARRDALARVFCANTSASRPEQASVGAAGASTEQSGAASSAIVTTGSTLGSRDSSTLLPGFLADTPAGAVTDFSASLGSALGLATVASTHGSVSLQSVLLSAAADSKADPAAGAGAGAAGAGGAADVALAGADAATGDGAEPQFTASAALQAALQPLLTSTAGSSYGSMLGAPLARGQDPLLACALSLKARHDAELLALLSCPSTVDLTGLRATASALLHGFVEPTSALKTVHQALRGQASTASTGAAGSGGVSPTSQASTDLHAGAASSGTSTPTTAADVKPKMDGAAVVQLLKAGCDATGSLSSVLYQRLRRATGSKAGGTGAANEASGESTDHNGLDRVRDAALLVSERAVARKLAAVHAVAVAEAARDALTATSMLYPVQQAVASAVQHAGVATGAADVHSPPLFLQLGALASGGAGSAAQVPPPTASGTALQRAWACVPLKQGQGGSGTGSTGLNSWLVVGTASGDESFAGTTVSSPAASAELLLTCPVLQHGSVKVEGQATDKPAVSGWTIGALVGQSAPQPPPTPSGVAYGVCSLTVTDGQQDNGGDTGSGSGMGALSSSAAPSGDKPSAAAANVRITGKACWADSGFMATVSAAGGPSVASVLQALRSPSAAGASSTAFGSVLLLECPASLLAPGCSRPPALSTVLDDEGLTRAAGGQQAKDLQDLATVHKVIQALSLACARIGASAVVLVAPSTPGAPAGGAGAGASAAAVTPEESFMPTVRAAVTVPDAVTAGESVSLGRPVLWASGAAASGLKRAAASAAGPSTPAAMAAPVLARPASSSFNRPSMFRSAAIPPLRTAMGGAPGMSVPAGAAGTGPGVTGPRTVTIDLPSPQLTQRLQMVIARRAVAVQATDNSGAAVRGAGPAKRARMEAGVSGQTGVTSTAAAAQALSIPQALELAVSTADRLGALLC